MNGKSKTVLSHYILPIYLPGTLQTSTVTVLTSSRTSSVQSRKTPPMSPSSLRHQLAKRRRSNMAAQEEVAARMVLIILVTADGQRLNHSPCRIQSHIQIVAMGSLLPPDILKDIINNPHIPLISITHRHLLTTTEDIVIHLLTALTMVPLVSLAPKPHADATDLLTDKLFIYF